ncbi:MAG: hypothetical protein R3191_05630 [Anaerolineales bacterium]|nr:hypothetical protein [Anaerolineales bacterium]
MRETPHAAKRQDRRDIPVMLDDVKELGEFRMTRCTFFRIEAGAAVVDYVAKLRGLGVPFTIFGSTSVVDRPSSKTSQFESPAQIEALFDRIEGVEGLVVETSHLWFPNSLFYAETHDQIEAPDQRETMRRGAVWRVARDLFALGLQFRRELISGDRFVQRCEDLLLSHPNSLHYNPAESEIFRQWSADQIRASQRNYEEKLQKEGLALPWRDEEGNVHAG